MTTGHFSQHSKLTLLNNAFFACILWLSGLYPSNCQLSCSAKICSLVQWYKWQVQMPRRQLKFRYNYSDFWNSYTLKFQRYLYYCMEHRRLKLSSLWLCIFFFFVFRIQSWTLNGLRICIYLLYLLYIFYINFKMIVTH